MQVPLHPMIVHLPMALTFILPLLILVFAFMIRKNTMSPKSWLIIMGLQLTLVISGYVSLETGETEEEAVMKVVSKDFIHKHEEAAEIFVGSTVLGLVLSVGAFFVRKELGFMVKFGVAALSLVSCFLAYRTGTLGGELTYTHGAASVYAHGESETVPETISGPAQTPVEVNESLKADENDYGSSDELNSNDDDLKQED